MEFTIGGNSIEVSGAGVLFHTLEIFFGDDMADIEAYQDCRDGEWGWHLTLDYNCGEAESNGFIASPDLLASIGLAIAKLEG